MISVTDTPIPKFKSCCDILFSRLFCPEHYGDGFMLSRDDVSTLTWQVTLSLPSAIELESSICIMMLSGIGVGKLSRTGDGILFDGCEGKLIVSFLFCSSMVTLTIS